MLRLRPRSPAMRDHSSLLSMTGGENYQHYLILLHDDHYFSARVSFFQIPDRLRGLIQSCSTCR